MSLDITPSIPAGRQVIQSYGGGKFVVAGAEHRGPLLVFAEAAISWQVPDFPGVTPESLAPLIERAAETDILLFGCGPTLLPISREVRDCLRNVGIVAEPMDTGAACRTFNVLLAEDRRVAAALISVA